MKPLFIPLKTEYFEAFDNGSKDTEYRAYGARWNERTCPIGRGVVLSKGYGKHARLTGVITGTEICINPPSAFYSIYGDGQRSEQKCFAIGIKIDQPSQNATRKMVNQSGDATDMVGKAE